MYLKKEKQKEYAHNHYLKNKDKVKNRALLFKQFSRKRNRDFIKDYLLKHPCVDCGECDIIVLEFDHVRGEKVQDIANAVNKGWSIEKIKNEIEKCDVRCANCHRRITHKRRKRFDTAA